MPNGRIWNADTYEIRVSLPGVETAAVVVVAASMSQRLA